MGSALLIALVIAAATIALAALFVLFCNNCLTVTRYSVSNQKAAKQIKIVHLSDLHAKSFGRGNAVLIKKAARENPDLFAVTGDLIHRYSPKDIAVALGLVATLKEIAPVYFVSGNHEVVNAGYNFFRRQLAEAGAVISDGKTAETCGIFLTGADDKALRRGEIPEVREEGKINILLAHEPQFFERFAGAGYDVALCGHAHGGQWRIPFTGKGLYAPSQGLFPKYSSGIHTLGKTSMVVSRGLGNSRFPLRLFNRPEIVVLTITK